jgi:hypothetical protein
MKKLSFLLTLVFIWTCSSPTKSKPAPQPPTVNNLSITTNEDTPATFTMTGSDPEGAALTFSISTQPTNGTVSISGAAGTYTPKENYHGQDTFAYIASDGTLSSTAGLVSVTITAVDDDPNTMDVTATTDEDTSVIITLEAEEVDGDNITFQLKTNPSNGSVTISGNQATYTPNENYYGSDSFTFEAVDSSAKRIINVATASITINPVNDAPVVEDISLEGWNTEDLTVTLTGSDVEEDDISFHIVDDPTQVGASIEGTNLTIKKSSAFWGADSLTYAAYDGTEYGPSATVYFTFKRYINYNRSSYELKHTELYLDAQQLHDTVCCWGTTGMATSIGPADFNGDGYIDFVVATMGAYPGGNGPGERRPIVMVLNNGDNENFTRVEDQLVTNNVGTEYGRKTLIGDFNGDNIPDAFFADHGYDGFGGGCCFFQSIMLSNENGTFDFNILENLPATYGHGAASGDIDNDGDLDIYVTATDDINYGGFFLINDGSGNFTPDFSILDYRYYEIYTAELAYVNDDPFIDLILGGGFPFPEDPGRNENVMVFYNSGGVFSIANSSEIPQPQIVRGDGGVIVDLAIKDINGDGFKEIISLGAFVNSGVSDYFFQIASHNGDFNFTDKTNEFMERSYGSHQGGFSRFRVQDIDKDGTLDLFRETKTDLYGLDPEFRWEWNGSKFIPQF